MLRCVTTHGFHCLLHTVYMFMLVNRGSAPSRGSCVFREKTHRPEQYDTVGQDLLYVVVIARIKRWKVSSEHTIS